MTLFGYIFWGGCIIVVGSAFLFQKKYGTKAPRKDIRDLENEGIASKTHNNDRPRI